jgi:vitamin B12/bleomycin/antimicrobial peptide transport system ATP-binding/permease protein
MSTAHVFWRDTWSFVRPYWTSKERHAARALLGAVVGLTLAMVYMSVRFNGWYNRFYDALQARDGRLAYRLVLQYCFLAAIYIGLAVYAVYLNQLLQLRWRRWMTGSCLREWLDRRTYYQMQLGGSPTDNPDQRIAEDLRLLVDGSLSLGLGLLNALVTLGSFVGILWRLSGSIPLRYHGHGVDLPGYMVWVALLYATAGTWLTQKLGRPLVRLNFQQQRREADFRFGLVRFRENAEGVALYHGEGEEMEGLDGSFRAVLDNWWQIMRRQKILSFFTVGYSQAAVIFPLVIALPRFFSGAILLGGLVQISNAFGQVQSSLSWFVGAFTTFAEWRATVDRLLGFQSAMRQVHWADPDRPGIVIAAGEDSRLDLERVELHLPDGRPLRGPLDLSIRAGESLLIRGPSGSGKSTLFRALAGIWPFGGGTIRQPQRFVRLFLPQRPYLPLGTLRRVVSYPDPVGRFPQAELEAVLRDCGLGPLVEHLDESRHWALELSPGEQQRIAIARALLQRPAWLFLDEATSALDHDLEQHLYELLRERLPDTTLVSIAHGQGLSKYHTRAIEIGGGGGEVRLLPLGGTTSLPGAA